MLIIFRGLPGTGKTTIARALAERLEAVYLRIDSIEQAIRASNVLPPDADVGLEGYFVACHLAADNLRMGRTVITDSINPDFMTRDAYKAVAETEAVSFLEVELVCSNKTEHRKRIESRKSDIVGLVLPTWPSVVAREYESWDRPHLVLDTGALTTQECLDKIMSNLSALGSNLARPRACHLTLSDDRNIGAWRLSSRYGGKAVWHWGGSLVRTYNQRESSCERRRS